MAGVLSRGLGELPNQRRAFGVRHEPIAGDTGQSDRDRVPGLHRRDGSVAPGEPEAWEGPDRAVQGGEPAGVGDFVEHPAHHGSVAPFMARDAGLHHRFA